MKNNPIASNSLRPVFAEKVAKWLDEGKAINLYAPAGQGMRRLVDDLAKHCPREVRLARVNMKTCAHALEAFLKALADGLGIALDAGEDYRSLVNRYLADHPTQHIWLCLERFDALAEIKVEDLNVDVAGYNLDFLNFLNGLCNQNQVSLLVCSQQPVRVRELYIAGKAVSGSKLEFSIKEALPNLSTVEIQDEFLRHCPELSAKPELAQELVLAAYNHKKPADFLAFLCAKQIDPGQDIAAFRQQLAAWRASFDKENTPSLDRRLGGLERLTRRWAIRLGRVLGIGKAWHKMGKTAKIAFGMAGAIALALWKWGEQFLAFLNAWLKN